MTHLIKRIIFDNPLTVQKQLYYVVLALFIGSIASWPGLIGIAAGWVPPESFEIRSGEVANLKRIKGQTLISLNEGSTFVCAKGFSAMPDILGKEVTIGFRKSQFKFPPLRYYAGYISIQGEYVYKAKFFNKEKDIAISLLEYMLIFFSLSPFILFIYVVLKSNLQLKKQRNLE